MGVSKMVGYIVENPNLKWIILGVRKPPNGEAVRFKSRWGALCWRSWDAVLCWRQWRWVIRIGQEAAWNNWAVTKMHVKQILDDISCIENTTIWCQQWQLVWQEPSSKRDDIFGSWTHSSGKWSLSSTNALDFGGLHGDLRRDRRRPSHCEGSAPSAPLNVASLEALQGDPEGYSGYSTCLERCSWRVSASGMESHLTETLRK